MTRNLINPSLLPFFKNHKLGIWLGLLLFLLSACSSNQLPTIHPVSAELESKIEQGCENLFPKIPIQYVHALEVTLPGQAISSVIGVTDVFPATGKLESVIITVEGLVIFHARYDNGKLQVIKSIKSFSSHGFSSGLLKDIQLIFLKPNGRLIESGTTDSGVSACVFQSREKNLVEILLKSDNSQEIRKYNNDMRLTRTVAFSNVQAGSESFRVPEQIILRSHGLFAYTIRMTLIRTDLPND